MCPDAVPECNSLMDWKEVSKYPNQLPPLSYLLECFEYDQETGALRWKKRPEHHFIDSRVYKLWNTKFAGKPAGSNRKSRLVVALDKKILKAHRVIWKIHYGTEPPSILDHANMNGTDNRIENLREATKSQNSQNRLAARHNTSGYRGVCYHKLFGKYTSVIKANGEVRNLGYFLTPEAAYAARVAAELELFGKFSPLHAGLD
jgi:HNH endonuclease